MQWHLQKFGEISTPALYELLRARADVFVVEQRCPYPDADGLDPECLHLSAWEGGRLVAYARLLPPGLHFPEAAFGRVLVAREFRGQGHARELIRRALAGIEKEFGAGAVVIEAQSYLRAFYAGFGFCAVSEEFLEDGIPHIKMLKEAEHE